MKLYRSLIYRELKLTRKRFILMLILFLLLALLVMTPAFLGAFSETLEPEEDPLAVTLLFTGFVALTGGVLAGTNNGLQKADISSGWKRYSFILPATARQQALSDLLIKLGYIVFFGALSLVYCLIYGIIAGSNVISHTMNIYFGTVSALMLVDTAYSYIVMFARDKTQLKIMGVIAFFGAGLILKVFDLFSAGAGLFKGEKASEQSADGGALISEEAFSKFLTTLGEVKTTLCVSGAFAVVCVLYFLVMWRSHERREP